MTSPYGMRLHPVYKVYKMHHGVDLQSKKGDTIVAAKGGVVTVASYQRGGAGYYVTINHGDGFSSSYMHMTHFVVKKGDYVFLPDVRNALAAEELNFFLVYLFAHPHVAALAGWGPWVP